MSDVGDYLQQFFENVGDSLNLEREKREVAEIYQNDLINPLRNQGKGVDISLEDVSNIVQDSTEEKTGSLGLIQSKFHIFEDCKDWRDVNRKIRGFTTKAYKETFMIQTFASGVVLVVFDNVTPVFRYIIGPSLIKAGYKNSDVLPKLVKRKVIDDYVQVDWEKGIPSI